MDGDPTAKRHDQSELVKEGKWSKKQLEIDQEGDDASNKNLRQWLIEHGVDPDETETSEETEQEDKS